MIPPDPPRDEQVVEWPTPPRWLLHRPLLPLFAIWLLGAAIVQRLRRRPGWGPKP